MKHVKLRCANRLPTRQKSITNPKRYCGSYTKFLRGHASSLAFPRR